MSNALDDALSAIADTPETLADTQAVPSYQMPAVATPDPLDTSLEDYTSQDDADRLRGTTAVGVKTQPSTATRILQLTGKTGLPQDFIERNLDYVEEETAKQALNPTSLIKDSPSFAQWMAEHPDHVAAAKPDAAALSFIEKQLRNIPAQFKQGQRTVEYGDVMLGVVQGLLDKTDVTELRKRQAALEAEMGQPDDTGLSEMTGVPGVMQRAPGWMAQQLPILGRTLEEQVVSGAKGVAGGAVLGGAAGGLPGAAVGGVVVGGAMWRMGAAMASAKMEFAQAFGEYEKLKDAEGNPLDQDTAMGLAGMVGVVNGTIDGFFGIEGLTSKLPGINQFTRQGIKDLLRTPTASRALLSYAKTVGQTMAVEGVTEAIQMYITKAGGVALQAVKDGGSPADWAGKIFSQENLTQAMTEAEAGAFGGGGIATVLAAPKLAQDIAKVRAANRTEKELLRLGEATASTKFHVELPDQLREIIDRATNDGPVETLYVPAHAFTEYFQKEGVDPREVYKEITGDVDAYDQSIETGADLPIKTADYVQKLAGTKHNKFFAHEMRASVDAMNAWEAAEWVKEQDAQEQAAAEQPDVQTSLVGDPGAVVRQDIAGQLTSLGFDPAVVDQYAALFESRYTTRAARRGLGETAADLFSQLNLGITRPVPAVLQQLGTTTELDALLDRLRTGDVPKEQEVLGQSLTEFLKARGGVQDQGGELSTRNIDRDRKPFKKTLIKQAGRTLDEAAQMAVEAGYLQERDIPALLNALDQEARGQPVYAVGKEKASALDVKTNLDALKAYLDQRGIDLKTATNAEIKKLFGEAVQQPLPGVEGQTFAQTTTAAPMFFSKLERVVVEKMGPKMPAADLRKMLLANGVKEEELKWVGLDDFLKGKGTVTKEAVLAFVQSNQVQVQEVVKGEQPKINEDEFFAKHQGPILQLRELGWNVTVDPGDPSHLGFFEEEDDGDMGDIVEARDIAEKPARTIAMSLGALIQGDNKDATKFESYQLPGGTDYRELLLTLPSKGVFKLHEAYMQGQRYPEMEFSTLEEAQAEGGRRGGQLVTHVEDSRRFFTTGHFSEPNVLAHVRFNSRMVDGKRVLFLEEVQSDWHQKGKRSGYAGQTKDHFVAFYKTPDGQKVDIGHGETEAQAMASTGEWPHIAQDAKITIEVENRPESVGTGGVPDAPFKKTWHELVLKRMLRYAAEKGYDSLAWTTGAQQAERYDLSKHIKELRVKRLKTGHLAGQYAIQAVGPQGAIEIDDAYERSKLPDVVGKDLADKIVSDFEEEGSAQKRTYMGMDLKVGGEGMKGFYDKIIPSFLNKYGKKWGAQVGETEIDASTTSSVPALEGAGELQADAFQGAEDFPNGDEPLTGTTAIMIDGVKTKMTILADANGLHMIDNNAEIELAVFNEESNLPWETSALARESIRLAWTNQSSPLWTNLQVIVGDATTFGPAMEDVEVHSFPVTAAMKRSVLTEGQPLFQSGDQPKGSITFGNQSISIKLLEKADLSTFIHETGHLYLNELLEDAKAVEAVAEETRSPVQQQLLTDVQTVRAWLGKESGALTTAQHEQFARGFEAYTMEGKSPSQAMREVFATFRRWLIQVYRSLTTAPLRVNLTRAVRDVLDRMIATDEEIDAAAAEADVHPMFTDAESAGMTPTQFAAYRDTVAKASLTARETLQKQLMAQYQRQHAAWWKERRAEKVAAITEAVNDQNVYVALSVLQTGKLPDGSELPEGTPPMKLDRKAIRDQMGEDFLKSMPPGTTKAKSLHPDTAAPMFGYQTGQALLLDLVNARPKNAVIQAEADQQMAAEYGDLLTDGTIAEAARAAVLNTKQEDVIAAEMRALNAKAREVKPFVKAAAAEVKAEETQGRQLVRTMIPTLEETRELARKIIGRMALKVLQPMHYSITARQASRKATEAFLKKQYLDAGHFKQQELLNLALYREAQIVMDRIQQARESFKDFFQADATLAKTRNVDLVNVGRAMLAQYGLGPPTAKTAAEYLSPIKTYDPDLYSQWQQVIDALAPRPLDYRALSVDEFTRFAEDLQSLWLLSRRTQQTKINDQLVDRQQIVDELSAVMAGFTKSQQAQVVGAQTPWADTTMGLLSWGSALKRVESWVRRMDGGNIDGLFRRYLWTPISEASDTFRAAKKDLLKQYLTIIQPIEKTLTRDLIPAPELGPEVSFRGKTALLHAILHTGNESNQSKLLRGYQWDSANWQRFLDRMYREKVLTKLDYDFAQGVWDLLDAIKPQAQQAHHEMYGYYFSEITKRPVMTPWGEYAGGYIPARPDPVASPDQAIRDEKNLFDQAGNSFAFPTTGRGATKSRIEEYAAPLQLDMTSIPVHLDWVMRFVHLEPRIKDAARLVTNKSFRTALDAMNSTVAKDMLVPWLQRSAQQTVSTPGKNRHADRLFRYLRKSVGAQIMVGNVLNTLQQFSGFPIAATMVKPKYLRGSMMAYLRHPVTYAEEIASKSTFMRGRTATQVIEIQQTIDDILVNPTKYDQVRTFLERHGYFLQQGTQSLVDLVTWGGAYDQATAQDLDERMAVRAADSAVRLTQGTFAPEDLSAFEAGTPFTRAFTMFYSYFNMQANLLTTEMQIVAHEMGLRKGAGRALWVYTMGFLIPAVLSESIIRGLGGFDPDDDDDYLNEALSLFFGSQLRTALAMIPGVGPITLAGIGAFTNKQYDDRISTSPIVTVLEAAVRAPHSVYQAMSEDGHTKRAVRDVLTLLGLVTGLPLGALARPLGYVADVTDGVAQPETAGDVARGLLSGKDVNRTK